MDVLIFLAVWIVGASASVAIAFQLFPELDEDGLGAVVLISGLTSWAAVLALITYIVTNQFVTWLKTPSQPKRKNEHIEYFDTTDP